MIHSVATQQRLRRLERVRQRMKEAEAKAEAQRIREKAHVLSLPTEAGDEVQVILPHSASKADMSRIHQFLHSLVVPTPEVDVLQGEVNPVDTFEGVVHG